MPNGCSSATKAHNKLTRKFYQLFLLYVGNQHEQLWLCPWLLLLSHSSCPEKLPSLYPHRTTCPGFIPSKISQETLRSFQDCPPKRDILLNSVVFVHSDHLATPNPALQSCSMPPGLALLATWQFPSHSPSFLPLLWLEADSFELIAGVI